MWSKIWSSALFPFNPHLIPGCPPPHSSMGEGFQICISIPNLYLLCKGTFWTPPHRLSLSTSHSVYSKLNVYIFKLFLPLYCCFIGQLCPQEYKINAIALFYFPLNLCLLSGQLWSPNILFLWFPLQLPSSFSWVQAFGTSWLNCKVLLIAPPSIFPHLSLFCTETNAVSSNISSNLKSLDFH